MSISDVRTFMYQLQNIEQPRALDALAATDYDLLVIEPTFNIKGNETFDIAGALAKLRAAKPDRLILAYYDPCQAETFRSYWQPAWIAPTKKKPGSPAFLLTPDPDGWSGDFNVAYWDPAWQNVVLADVRAIMSKGFDGLYLDWIDAYDDDAVAKHAKAANVAPAQAMVDFLLEIRETARSTTPGAVIVQQNAIYLPNADARWSAAVDAVGVEDTWFHGKANAKWGSKNAGDLANKDKDDSSTAARLKQYAAIKALGKPVLTIDYCRNKAHAAQVYNDARANGLVPLVTQVSLDHLTETPPPK